MKMLGSEIAKLSLALWNC